MYWKEQQHFLWEHLELSIPVFSVCICNRPIPDWNNGNCYDAKKTQVRLNCYQCVCYIDSMITYFTSVLINVNDYA